MSFNQKSALQVARKEEGDMLTARDREVVNDLASENNRHIENLTVSIMAFQKNKTWLTVHIIKFCS